MNKIKLYESHGQLRFIREDLVGKNKEYCLCYKCARFIPDYREFNCKIANEVYALDVKYGVTTPVWECGDLKSKVLVEIINV